MVFQVVSVQSQDSLTTEMAQEFSYSFTIDNGKLSGEGVQFITKESANSQYTLIGEYHGSKRISEFTEVLIPVLNDNGYRHFALEIGPVSANKLMHWTTDSKNVEEKLFEFNSRYNYIEGRFTAIPFFTNKEDAVFLQKAADNEWEIFGLDQEFYFAFEMLLDEIYSNIDSKSKELYQESFQVAKDSLLVLIDDDINEKRRLPAEVHQSVEVQGFLNKMKMFPANKKIVNAFNKSIEIYKMNSDRKWRQNNEERALYMKTNLRKSMEASEFDFQKDKMLVKMGAYHNSRGQSPMEVFDVGNTLSELAEFYGNQSLHIAFSSRFYMEEGSEKDVLIDEPKHSYNVFNALGKKDSWVVIDLREIQHGMYYYPVKYKVTKEIEDLIRRYDLLVIPPIETDPTPNLLIRK